MTTELQEGNGVWIGLQNLLNDSINGYRCTSFTGFLLSPVYKIGYKHNWTSFHPHYILHQKFTTGSVDDKQLRT